MRGLHPNARRAWLAAAGLAMLLGGACTDEDIVFRDREPFNPPPDEAAGFLGYYTTADKQTTCGNCHADKQIAWVTTAHADAWATLQNSGSAEAACEGCHSVSENGNVVTGAAGHNAVPDSSYQDVQCESCHGPGNNHVMDPKATHPLASILADPAATNGCGECHSGTHQPFVEQWADSRHAATSSATERAGCSDCHGGRQALLAQFGQTADYLEKGDASATIPIVCVVCHDPHGGPYDAQLRAPIDVGSRSNLCIKCHNRITVPTATTHGPHAAQGPLVLGQNIGWWPPGFEWLEGLTASHGNPSVNPRLCATCHVEMFEVTDAATGDFVFQSVGHRFEAIPCVDADGIPVPGPCALNQRTFSACATCHGSAATARNVYIGFQNTLNPLLDQIWTDTNGDRHVDPAPTDGGLLASIVAQRGGKELDVSDTLFTFAEGVLWNAMLAWTDGRPIFSEGYVVVAPGDTVEFSAHPTSGNGVHNPAFLENLLKASIQAASDYYSIPVPAGLDLTLTVAPPDGGRDR